MSFRFLRIEMNDVRIQEKSFGGHMTESTDVSCYEKQENFKIENIEEIKEKRIDFVKENKDKEGMVEEGRPVMALTLKINKNERHEGRSSPKGKTSLVFCLKKNIENFDDECVTTSNDSDDDNNTLLGKRSSPCPSEEILFCEEIDQNKKLNRKKLFFEEKLEGELGFNKEKKFDEEDCLIKKTMFSMKRIKSTIISRSKTVRIDDLNLDYKEIKKIPLKKSISEKIEKCEESENEIQNTAPWWTIFGDDVDMLTLMNISESIYSQLKISKE